MEPLAAVISYKHCYLYLYPRHRLCHRLHYHRHRHPRHHRLRYHRHRHPRSRLLPLDISAGLTFLVTVRQIWTASCTARTEPSSKSSSCPDLLQPQDRPQTPTVVSLTPLPKRHILAFSVDAPLSLPFLRSRRTTRRSYTGGARVTARVVLGALLASLYLC
jgi:hypothetical protein